MVTIFERLWQSPIITNVSTGGIGEWVVFALLHSIWIGAILALGVMGIVRCSRIPIAVRYWFSVIALVLIPCLAVVFTVSQQGRWSPPVAQHLQLSEISRDQWVGLSQTDKIAEVAFQVTHDETSIQQPATEPAQASVKRISLFDIVFVAYLAGVLVMLRRVGQSFAAQARIQSIIHQHASHAYEETMERLRDAAEAARKMIGLRCFVTTALANRVTAAVVVGCIRPIVLVNVTLATGLTPRQLEQILVHEFAHIVRHDPLVLLGQRLLESLLFFNPAIWYVSRQVSELREFCCDQWVVRHFDPTEYAETLVECAEREFVAKYRVGLAVTGRSNSGLRRRIGVLLRQPAGGPSRRKQNRGTGTGSASKLTRLVTGVALLLTAVSVCGHGSLSSSPAKFQQSAWPWLLDESQSIDMVAMTLNSQQLRLDAAKPADLQVEAMIDLRSCLFAEFQFGDTRSTPVTLIIELAGEEPRRLYVDANRDRTIDPNEEVRDRDESNGVWQAVLNVEVGQAGERIRAKRRVALWVKQDHRAAYLATLGHAEGTLVVGKAEYKCRRVDNDGDGIPLNSNDDILIDLNQDDQFDVVSERFSPAPWITISGEKYSLRSDALGQELRLDPITAMAHVKFRVSLADDRAAVVSMQGILRDRRGSFIPLKLDQSAVELVPGEYCLEYLVTTVHDGNDGIWKICQTQAIDERWIRVRADEPLEIELLSPPQLIAEPVLAPYGGGQTVTALKTFLMDQHGLVITDFQRLDGPPAGVELRVARPDRAHVENRSVKQRSVEFRCGSLGSLTLGKPRESNGSWTVDALFDSGPFFGKVRRRADIQVDLKQ